MNRAPKWNPAVSEGSKIITSEGESTGIQDVFGHSPLSPLSLSRGRSSLPQIMQDRKRKEEKHTNKSGLDLRVSRSVEGQGLE